MKKLIEIGYWKRNKLEKSDLPWPQDLVDPNWNEEEKELVSIYLSSAEAVAHYFGWSNCRFGCKEHNGCADLSDGTYIWPEGYWHYTSCHNVKPPQEFINHVYKNLPNQKEKIESSKLELKLKAIFNEKR